MFRDDVVPTARILGTGSYAPERVLGNAELEGRLSTTAGWIEQHTGIERRRVAAEGEATSDLAVKASRRAIAAAGLSVADLDLIVTATSTPDSPLPACAAHVQNKLGADLIPSFDLNASSAGFLYALTLAEQFITVGTCNTVLVVGAEIMSRVIDPLDRNSAALFGDAAGAVVLGPAGDDGRGILSSKLQADGTFADMMQVPAGGVAEPLSAESIEARRHLLDFRASELRDITVKHLTSYSMQALKAARLTSAELDWVVPQQGHMGIVRTISERLGYPLDKFILNMQEYGNTGAASIPLALDEGVRDGRIEPGHTVLTCALGAGITWGAMMVRM